MRIALCFYGQPRKFSINWPHFKSNIIDGNSVDVFFHTWYDSENRGINKMTPGFENMLLDESLENIMPSMLSPKRFIIEKQKQFNDKLIPVTDENIDECWSYAKQYNREDFIKYTVKSHYSMWYSINQSLLLKELYAQENNFEYDCVILSRFDISPKNVIDFNSLDLSKLVSGYKELPRGEVNDWFMITNNINSNILASIFYSIDFHRNRLLSEGKIWTNEAYLRDQLDLFGIKVLHREDFQITF